MALLLAHQRNKVVTCVTCSAARDGSHEHVMALTVRSIGGHDRRISLSDAVTQLRHPLGERYLAAKSKAGEPAEVVLGPCPVCRQEPYVLLKGGGRLEDLPRCG
jgi:hypothetical protein